MKIDRIIEAIGGLPKGAMVITITRTNRKTGERSETRLSGGTTDDLKLLADRAEAADRYEAMLAEAAVIEFAGTGDLALGYDGQKWAAYGKRSERLGLRRKLTDGFDTAIEAHAAALDAFSAGKENDDEA
jgi:hypothetical protein